MDHSYTTAAPAYTPGEHGEQGRHVNEAHPCPLCAESCVCDTIVESSVHRGLALDLSDGNMQLAGYSAPNMNPV